MNLRNTYDFGVLFCVFKTICILKCAFGSRNFGEFRGISKFHRNLIGDHSNCDHCLFMIGNGSVIVIRMIEYPIQVDNLICWIHLFVQRPKFKLQWNLSDENPLNEMYSCIYFDMHIAHEIVYICMHRSTFPTTTRKVLWENLFNIDLFIVEIWKRSERITSFSLCNM